MNGPPSFADCRGICPSCTKQGAVGAACHVAVCSRHGYRFIPSEHYRGSVSETLDPLIGLVVGDYLLVSFLGAGSYGRVYLGLQLPIFMRVAVKIIDVDGLPRGVEPVVREKFEAEARALAVVSHPNVVKLLQYGSFADRPFLVTEYVEGELTLEMDIEDRAQQARAFGMGEIRDIARQLLDGLFAVHAQGIIHRDIKPANLMLQDTAGYPRMVRILDFGLAKFLASGDYTLTTAGTPDYMAPEQIFRQNMGPWTDLYATGTIIYELLAAQKPFYAATVEEAFLRKVDRSFDPVAQLDYLELPARVTAFLRRALAFSPEDRFVAADQMRAALDEAFVDLGEDAMHLEWRGPPSQGFAHKTVKTADRHKQSADAFRQWLEREEVRLRRAARDIGK